MNNSSSSRIMVDALPVVMDSINEKPKNGMMEQCSENNSISSSSSLGDCSTKPVQTLKKHKNQQLKKRKRNRKAPSAAKKDQLSREEKNLYVALDCEMVGVGHNDRSSLARVCIVDWDGTTLLDLYVKQRQDVTDYRTFVSGITEEHLNSEYAVQFEECQRRVKDILKNKILVGHALRNDLTALRISHPWFQLRDTGKYEPFMKVRFDDGALWPRKLKDLVKEKLKKEIQVPGKPHCPFEDAKAAFALYKKVRNKWEKTMEYKIKKTKEIQNKQTMRPSE